MATEVSAVKDKEIIRILYRYGAGPAEPAADLIFELHHKYLNSLGIQEDLVLGSFPVPASYLTLTGNPSLSTTQVVNLNVINLRYTKDLSVSVLETRKSGPQVTRVPVLDGDEANVYSLPSNPERSPEFTENLPVYKPEAPVNNVVAASTPVRVVVYSIKEPGVHVISSGNRILPSPEGTFRFVSTNQESGRYFSENSLSNLEPNPRFLSTSRAGIPDHHSVVAPGFIVSNSLTPGNIENSFVWAIRASNPSTMNAFNRVLIEVDKIPISPGTGVLTYSAYYLLDEAAFDRVSGKFSFFDGSGTFLSSSTVNCPVSTTLNQVWQRFSLSTKFSQIPLAARSVAVEIGSGPIEMTDFFTFSLYLPQLEPYSNATSATLTTRIADKLQSLGPVPIGSPTYIAVTTYHHSGFGVRGLVDSTSNGTQGFQWTLSNGAFILKVLDGLGNVSFNKVSSALVATEGDRVKYGLGLTKTSLNFYLNDVLVESTPWTQPLGYNGVLSIGSLFSSNSGVNEEILDFGVYQLLP